MNYTPHDASYGADSVKTTEFYVQNGMRKDLAQVLEISQKENDLSEVPATADIESNVIPALDAKLANLVVRDCREQSPTDSSRPEVHKSPQPRLQVSDALSSDVEICSYVDETQMPHIVRLISKDLSEPYSIYTYRYFIHNWPQLCFLAKIGDDHVGAIVCKIDTSWNAYDAIGDGHVGAIVCKIDTSWKGVRIRLATATSEQSFARSTQAGKAYDAAKIGDGHVGAIVCKIDTSCKGVRRGYIAMLAVDESARKRNIGTELVRQSVFVMQRSSCDEVVLETEVTNKAAIRLYEKLGFIRDKRLFRYYLNGVDAFRLKLYLSPSPP